MLRALLGPATGFWTGSLAVLACLALWVFIEIQKWMESPLRKEFNAAWFVQFEAHLRERYQDRELAWRAHAMEQHFDHYR